MTTIRLLFILGFGGLVACSTSTTQISNSSPTVKEIVLGESVDTLYFSQIFDSVSFIPLTSPTSNLIGRVGKLKVEGNRVFIMDPLRTSLSVFDKSGKWLFDISQSGKGPGELVKLHDFVVGAAQQQIWLTDPGKTIQIFDWEGDFVEQKKARLFFKQFEKLNESTFALYTMVDNSYSVEGNEDLTYNLFLTDANFDRLKAKSLPYRQGLDDFRVYNRFHRNQGKLFATYSYFDTIYEVRSDGAHPAYHLNFGSNTFDPEILEDYSEDLVSSPEIHDKLIQRGVHYPIDRFFFTDEYLFISSAVQNRTRLGFYHFPTKRVLYGNQLINDINGIQSYKIMAADNKNLYFQVEPSDILTSSNPQITELRKQVTPNSNPILMVARLK